MMMKPKILIIDDEPVIHSLFEHMFKDSEYEVKCVSNGRDGLKYIEENFGAIQIVVLDFGLPINNGDFICQRIKNLYPKTPVVIFSGVLDEERAQACFLAGADAVIKKGDAPLIEAAVKNRLPETVSVSVTASKKSRVIHEILGLPGKSNALYTVSTKAKLYSQSSECVLISGENGVGKEAVAKAIHIHSQRSEGPFIAVNCGAISATLFESSFFGAVKGAYTGANSDKIGYFEAAEGGTLFLDEIGELSPEHQTKLLRVLETKDYTRVGSTESRLANVRVVAATNRNLRQEISNGNFREDLFFRINVLPIDIAPLRERKDDIPEIVEFLLTKESEDQGYPKKAISSEALEILIKRAWTGNVRELRNVLSAASVFSGDSQVVNKNHLPKRNSTSKKDEIRRLAEGSEIVSFGELRNEYEKQRIASIKNALALTGNYSEAAELLGTDRSSLRKESIKRGLDKYLEKNSKNVTQGGPNEQKAAAGITTS